MKRHLKSDIISYYIIKLIGVVISLLISLFVLKNISPGIYGNWTRINLLIALGTLFVSFGSRKYVYKVDGPLELIVAKLNTQIAVLSVFLLLVLYPLTEYKDCGTLIVIIVILPFSAFYQIFQASAEKLSLTRTSIADILITVVLKSVLILTLSFYPSLGVLIFILPMAVSAFCKTLVFVRLSGLKFRFAQLQIPNKSQIHLALTNISDWSFANAFKILLVALLPMSQVGLIDRSTAFLRVPTNLVHEAAQRVLYTRKNFRESNLYILFNIVLIVFGSFAVYVVFNFFDIGGDNWEDLAVYMFLLLPYIIIEAVTNLYMPIMEMTTGLVRVKTLFNVFGIFLFLVLFVIKPQLKVLIGVMTMLEFFRFCVYLFFSKRQRRIELGRRLGR